MKRARASTIRAGLLGRKGKHGVSNSIFAVVVIIIIAIASVAAYGAYTLGGGGARAGASSSTLSSSGTGSTSSVTTSSTSPSAPGPSSENVSISDAMALMRTPLAGASVSQSTDSITFSSPNVSVTAFAIAPQNATSITGMHPPSYSQGDVFMIGGMIDPTLNFQNGASVRFTIVNMANNMYHDFVISTAAPPYPSTMAQYMVGGGGYGQSMGGAYGVGYGSFLYMMSVLSPANYGEGWASTYSYTVTIPNYGSLWYLCTYPGHAEGGMYGKIVTTTGTGTSTSTTSNSASSTSSSTALPPGTISISAATALLKTPLVGANVSQAANSVTFTSRNINIVAFAIMPEDATSLTGMQPPSYAKDDVFVIGGLIDPTLYVPKGATVNVTVVNLDNDMYHDFVVSTIAPPYPYMTMQGMMWGSGGILYMMQVLSPANYASGWAHVYSYTVTVPNSANLWYLCSYPGHAESGMYGEVVTT